MGTKIDRCQHCTHLSVKPCQNCPLLRFLVCARWHWWAEWQNVAANVFCYRDLLLLCHAVPRNLGDYRKNWWTDGGQGQKGQGDRGAEKGFPRAAKGKGKKALMAAPEQRGSLIFRTWISLRVRLLSVIAACTKRQSAPKP